MIFQNSAAGQTTMHQPDLIYSASLSFRQPPLKQIDFPHNLKKFCQNSKYNMVIKERISRKRSISKNEVLSRACLIDQSPLNHLSRRCSMIIKICLRRVKGRGIC